MNSEEIKSEKTIKNYLHLYLGCEVQTPTRHYSSDGGKSFKVVGRLMDIDLVIHQAGVHLPCNALTDLENYPFKELKPILRPLSSMTEEVLKDIFNTCYFATYSYEVDFSLELVQHGYDLGIKAFDGKYHYGLTVNNSGALFSVDGKFLSIPIYDVTRILLKNGFDLYDLIPEGLAIEKLNSLPSVNTTPAIDEVFKNIPKGKLDSHYKGTTTKE